PPAGPFRSIRSKHCAYANGSRPRSPRPHWLRYERPARIASRPVQHDRGRTRSWSDNGVITDSPVRARVTSGRLHKERSSGLVELGVVAVTERSVRSVRIRGIRDVISYAITNNRTA